MSTIDDRDTTGHLTWLGEKLEEFGVALGEEGLLSRAALRVDPVTLAELADPRTGPAAVGLAWKSAMDRWVQTTPADLAMLLLVHRALETDRATAHRSLRGVGFNWDGTWCEVHFRLTGALYDLGRTALREGRTELGRHLHQVQLHEGEAITAVLPYMRFKHRQLKLFHGMRGVASLTLARQEDDASGLLAHADEQLELADGYGDHSPEHFRYHIETKTRLAELAMNRTHTGKPAEAAVDRGRVPELLGQCEDLLERSARLGFHTRELSASEGDVAYRWGLYLLALRDASGALTEFERSVAAYESAEAIHSTTDAFSDRFLALLRGQARVRVHIGQRVTGDLTEAGQGTWEGQDGEPDALDTAIAELAVGATAADNTSYPAALITRARIRLGTADVDGALGDIDTAFDYLRSVGWLSGHTVIAPPASASQVLRQVTFARILQDEAALRRATQARDAEEIERLLDLLLAVDDQYVHGGALAQAAFALAAAHEQPECAERLKATSLKLEQQLARPLRPALRHRLADSAATLAALALGGAEWTHELERIHALSQTALRGGESGPVFQRRAGRAALRLARRLQAGDEWHREQAVQLLRDALALFVSALGDDTAAELGDAGELVGEMLAPASDEPLPEPSAAPDPYDDLSTAVLDEQELGLDASSDVDPVIERRLAASADQLLDETMKSGVAVGPPPDCEAPELPVASGSTPEGVPAEGVLDERLREDWLTRAPELPEDLSRAALEGWIGECHMRLHAITGAEGHAGRALDHFARSWRHGNRDAHLLGLVGDVYLVRGRARRHTADLRLAVGCKSAARALGSLSWENWAVSVTAHQHLFHLGSADDLMRAFACADEAARLAPDWSWPLFQLAELSSAPEADRARAAQELDGTERSEILRLALAGQRGELLSRGVDLVVRHKDFDRSKMGGRMDGAVYAVPDPHRLLSSAIVVKERPRGFARTEQEQLTGFAEWTAGRALGWIKVPKVIETVPLPAGRVREGREVALVMGRVWGRPVSSVTADRVAPGSLWTPEEVRDVAERVLHALASFHHWRGPCPEEACSKSSWRLEREIRGQLAVLGRAVDGGALAALCSVTAGLPLAAQRDAHADNWLIPSYAGESSPWVAPIDLEASDWRPVLLEVAQFIEDFALLPVDDRYFETRVELATRYLTHLPVELAPAALRDDPDRVRRAYETFALARAFFVLRHLRPGRRASEGLSTGGRRLKRTRQAHCEELIAYLRGSAFPEVAAVASAY